MTQGTLKINTDKLLPIIKQWLYSEKDIFLRELVSNACDALSKLKILRDHNEVDVEDSELQITIQLDKEKKTLTLTDTGIGMTAEEVEKYIAQLAFSGAEEFLAKYQKEEQVIGHFGLGFYSVYMVASKVEIDTLSYQAGAEAAFWSCDGSSTYTLDPGTRTHRGTQITLYLEDEEYLNETTLQNILHRYCSFLPYPIYLGDDHINAEEPLWLKAASDCTEKEYLDFYHKLYPLDPDPIFWVHFNVDYPFHLKGILYFPKLHHHFDFQKSAIQLYCQRVFVSDQCQDLIPDYLRILKGALDSPDIPLNVSRSYLQVDKTVRSLSTHIAKKVADRLKAIHTTDPQTFFAQWEEIDTIVKVGCLQDEKFYERVKEILIFKNLSKEWTTISDYLERNKEKHPDKVFYTQEIDAPFLNLYKEKGLEVLIARHALDTPLIHFLESKYTPAKFQRVDGAIDPAILHPEKENQLLDADGRTEGAKLADFFRSCLRDHALEVEAKSLHSETLPAFIVIDEKSRRLRESFKFSRTEVPAHLLEKRTLVLNTNSPLIKAIAAHKDPELAKELGLQLYQLAQLSQKELAPEELPQFIERTTQILARLLQ